MNFCGIEINDDTFRSEAAMKRFEYAWIIAEKVNRCIDRGDIVFDGDRLFTGRFVLEVREGEDTPTIRAGNTVWYGWEWYTDGRVYVPTKKEITRRFGEMRVIDRKHIRRIRG